MVYKDPRYRLKIRCEAPEAPCASFLVSVFAKNGLELSADIRTEEYAEFLLPANEYRIAVKSRNGLEPCAITKCVQTKSYGSGVLHFVFRPVLRFDPIVRFTLSDKNHPEITQLNGGITVWRKPTTHLNL